MNRFTLKSFAAKHRTLWSDKFFIITAIIGVFFFALSLFVNYGAVKYTNIEAGNPTTDILLDNLPLVNTDFIFSEGALLFVIFVTILLILEPKTIPFTLKSVALFICIRSLFVIMTHLSPFPDHIIPDLDSLGYFSSGADLFFSGHVGMPFLLALLYWQQKNLRRLFLLSSLTAAVAVILGHLHYTIDVFSAFFITYGIYHIAQIVFPKDYQIFTHGLQSNPKIKGF
ncbi:MAG: phosphatase PAP2-related protein [Patescibacteria group bacterium]